MAPLLLASAVLFVASCSKAPLQQLRYQPAEDPDPERGSENQLRLPLAKVNTRENELGTLARAGGRTITPEVRRQAYAEREKYYDQKQFIAVMRSALEAIHEKMVALGTERAAVANLAVSNVFNVTNGALINSNLPPDEHSEEINLKSGLFELQNLMEELALSGPPDANVPSQSREKAAEVRSDIYTPETYVAGLSAAIELLERKLEGLNAEAAVYERLLGLVPTTHSSKIK